MLFFLRLAHLLPCSDWTASQRRTTSDCYLCVIRRRTQLSRTTLCLSCSPPFRLIPQDLLSGCSSTFDPSSALLFHCAPLSYPSYCPFSSELLPLLLFQPSIHSPHLFVPARLRAPSLSPSLSALHPFCFFNISSASCSFLDRIYAE